MTPQQLKAMKLALEALKWSKPHEDAVISHSEAITTLEETLAEHAMIGTCMNLLEPLKPNLRKTHETNSMV